MKMTLEILQQDMIKALKGKDQITKNTIAGLIGVIKKTAIDKNCRDNITEELVDSAILKELKTAKEMIDTCPAHRKDLLEEYKIRYSVIEGYAPKLMSEDEIKQALTAFSQDNDIPLIKSNRAKIMKGFMPLIKGKADGKFANQIITKILEEG